MSYKVDFEPNNPSDHSLAAITSASLRIRPNDSNLESWYSHYAQNHRVRLAHDLDLVKQFCEEKSSSIADVACIPPILQLALTEDYPNVEGIDIEPNRFEASIIETELRVQKCDIETTKIPFADNSFDLVVFNEIFEHLRINPISTLADVKRIIKPGGLLIMGTPNGLSARSLERLLLKGAMGPDPFREYSKLRKLGHMGHVREYTSAELVSFTESVGFMPELLRFRSSFRLKRHRLACVLFPKLRPRITLVLRKPS